MTKFLDCILPSDGRPIPRGVKAKDVVHRQTEMVVDEIDPAVDRLREQRILFVSRWVCCFPTSDPI